MRLTQPGGDHVCLFALPHMLLHLGMVYAGLRHAGMDIGKANFDGFHLR